MHTLNLHTRILFLPLINDTHSLNIKKKKKKKKLRRFTQYTVPNTFLQITQRKTCTCTCIKIKITDTP